MTFSNIYIFIGTVALILYPDTVLSINNGDILNFDVQAKIGKKDDEIYLRDIIVDFYRNKNNYFNVTISQLSSTNYFNLYLLKQNDLQIVIKDEKYENYKIPISWLCKCTEVCKEFTVTIKLNNNKESTMSCNNGKSEYLAKSKIQSIWMSFKFRLKQNTLRSQFLKVYSKEKNVLYYFEILKKGLEVYDGSLLTFNNPYGYLNFSLSNECVAVSVLENKPKVLYGLNDCIASQWRDTNSPNVNCNTELIFIVIVPIFMIIIGIICIVILKWKKLITFNIPCQTKKNDEKNQNESQSLLPANNADATDGKKKDEINQGGSENSLPDNNAETSDRRKKYECTQVEFEEPSLPDNNADTTDGKNKEIIKPLPEENKDGGNNNNEENRRNMVQLEEKFANKYDILIKNNEDICRNIKELNEKFDELTKNNEDICRNIKELNEKFDELTKKKDEINQGESQSSPPDNNADTTDGKKKDEKNQGENEKLLSDNNAGTSDGKNKEIIKPLTEENKDDGNKDEKVTKPLAEENIKDESMTCNPENSVTPKDKENESDNTNPDLKNDDSNNQNT